MVGALNWVRGARRDSTISGRPKGLDGWSWSEPLTPVQGTGNAGIAPLEPLDRGLAGGDADGRDAAATATHSGRED